MKELGDQLLLPVAVSGVARGVHQAKLPPMPAGTMALEYYIQATLGARTLVYPATAPAMNQTVVVSEMVAR